MEKDLSLVPLDDIMQELNKRFDVWIFSGIQVRNLNKGTSESIVTTRKWRGNSAACSGLASQIQIAIFDNHLSHEICDETSFEE